MGHDTAYRIEALTPQTWPAFEALVTRHNGIFGGCWCTWFHDGHPSCQGRGETYEGNRAVKKRLVEKGVAHAALVMAGAEAVASMYGDMQGTLENLSEQRVLIDDVAERLARLDFSVQEAKDMLARLDGSAQEAQGTLRTLQREREVAERVEKSIKAVRAGGPRTAA